MTLNKRSQYAVQALIYIALKTEAPVLSYELAEILNISRAQINLILVSLCKHGLLRSKRGAQGGYKLKRELHDINLMQIIRATT